MATSQLNPIAPVARATARVDPAAPERGRFVGRTVELDLLLKRLDASVAGHGSIVVVNGEPGIGKTRIAEETADQAASRGVQVYWGRCFEGEWSPPYAAWVDVLDAIAGDLPAAELRRALGQGAPPLARLVPRIIAALPDLPAPAHLGPAEEQFRLFDAATQFLLAASAASPLMIVFDDLQWADRASLNLLAFLARFVEAAPLLLIGTYRDLPLRHDHPLTDFLGTLQRERASLRLSMRGLSEREASDLLETVAPRPVPPALVRAIHAETSGNPFFMAELTRHLVEEGRLDDGLDDWHGRLDLTELGIPEGVRQVVGRRFARLSQDGERLLSQAAVCTGGFDFNVLAALTGLPEEALLDAIDEALAARLIQAVPGKLETYDFVHAIVRHALYEAWNPSRRVRLHRKLAEALERVYQGRESEHAAELAVHYHASLSLPGAERGLPHALAAAEQARRGFARERVITFLRIARDLARHGGAEQRAEILGMLAVAEADALMLDDAQRTVDETLAALDELDAPPGRVAAFLAEAATAIRDGGARRDGWRPLVDRGLEIVPEEDELTWARLTLLIERFEPVVSGAINGARWLGTNQRAIGIARTKGTEDDFARSLQPWDWWSRDWTEELLARVQSWQQPTAIIRALVVGGADWLYHHSNLSRAIVHFEELLAAAERYGSIPGQAEALVRLAIARTALGHFDEARETHRRARQVVTRLGPDHRLHASVAWIDALRAEFLDGDWRPIAAFWTRYVADPALGRRSIGLDDAGLAALANLRAGDPDAARSLLDDLVPVIARMEPTLWLLNGAIGAAGSAIWFLGAREYAEVVRVGAIGLIEYGNGDFPGFSNELTAARMATLLGRTSEAASYFDRARAVLDGSGQAPMRAIVDLDQATALLRAATPDVTRAEELLVAAQVSFRQLGMTPWEREASETLTRIRGARRPAKERPAGLTDREVDVLRLVARGYPDRQISEDLFVSPRTVNAHIRNMLGKTMCSNRTELSVWAVEHELAGPSEA
ncbi:MAG: helix-turn-helix transcriptional regulator [Thermomicrobiales bacterium]